MTRTDVDEKDLLWHILKAGNITIRSLQSRTGTELDELMRLLGNLCEDEMIVVSRPLSDVNGDDIEKVTVELSDKGWKAA